VSPTSSAWRRSVQYRTQHIQPQERICLIPILILSSHLTCRLHLQSAAACVPSVRPCHLGDMVSLKLRPFCSGYNWTRVWTAKRFGKQTVSVCVGNGSAGTQQTRKLLYWQAKHSFKRMKFMCVKQIKRPHQVGDSRVLTHREVSIQSRVRCATDTAKSVCFLKRKCDRYKLTQTSTKHLFSTSCSLTASTVPDLIYVGPNIRHMSVACPKPIN
jgi:hypothetical protein